MLYLEVKWSSLLPYQVSCNLLHDVLPVNEKLSAVTMRNHLFAVAERMEQELGEERRWLIEGCEPDGEPLPIPDGPLTVGLDGGLVRARHKRGCFEVIAGQSVSECKRDDPEAEQSKKCFGFVQSYDGKPRRRLLELLKSQGMAMNQQVTFLSDGGDDVRQIQPYLNPEAEYWLDWFHIDADHGDETDGQRPGERTARTGGDEQPASRGAGAEEHRERAPESEMESLAWQRRTRMGAYRRPAMGVGVHDREVREPKQAIEAAAGI
jgi:hypothetical protein